MSLPPLTEFDDPVARFLEWHHIRAFYADNDDAAMAKAYPQAKKHLKEWEAAFIALPKDSFAKGFFMTIVGAGSWSIEAGPDNPDDMATMHHDMAIGMPWTADQGLALERQRKLEQSEDGDFVDSDTGLKLKELLPSAIFKHNARMASELKALTNLDEKDKAEEIKRIAIELKASEAIVEQAASMGWEVTDPEFLDRADKVIREAEAGLINKRPDFDPADFKGDDEFTDEELAEEDIHADGFDLYAWHQASSELDEDFMRMAVENALESTEEAPIKDDTVIKSAKAPVEQQAPSAKAFTVEQALLNPKASKDRSKYKSAYFLWGQIKSHHNVGERFKLTETQASTWAGVAKGQHTKDVVKVLVDVRAIERIKRTLDYRRLV